jgi:hypothetical protein
MKYVAPEPTPIPPELPNDPSRSPPPDLPLNTPPEKGPGRPEPLPLGPTRPRPVARAWLGALACMGMLAFAGDAFAQTPAGKDTTTLEPPNPQQSECSQITSSEKRAECLRRNQPSGAPPTGKTTGDQPAAVAPSVGREMRPVPKGEAPKRSEPEFPEHSR